MATKKPKHGDLEVWWIPQIPMKSFRVRVSSPVEAKLLLDTLADYDKFRFDNKVKPDYSNVGGLCAFDAGDHTDGQGGSWITWYDDDGNGIEDYALSELRERCPAWEMA